MNVFLTGGTGFIGSHVALALVRHGHKVTILARTRHKVPALLATAGLEIVEGDLGDLDLLARLVSGKGACIHVALKYSEKAGHEVLRDDTLPTVFLAGAAAKAGVASFIYTSSTSANDSLYLGGQDPWDEPIQTVTARTKQHPATFYGATKAASENFLTAQSHLSPMRVNIVRPGYTFGNPVVEGGSIESDARFRAIAQNAAAGRPIDVIKNDGTQFIWAGDLAKLYAAILGSSLTRRTYFGLSKRFVTWQAIALEAVKRCGSRSPVHVEDKGWSDAGTVWDVSDMKRDFGLEFDPWEKIQEHLDYLISLARI
jgi:UDP-glucose 4-epimerase